MERQPLVPHPYFPPPAGVSLSARWAMHKAEGFEIEYHFADPNDRILWPAPASERTDSLWQHSCFEAFIAPAAGPGYAEVNFSPPTAWAAYAFDSYRAGMRDLAMPAPPQIAHAAADTWHATLDLASLADLIGPAPWKLAVTAVIEARDGSKSFWSLAHPPGKPDFHHADCFAARLG